MVAVRGPGFVVFPPFRYRVFDLDLLQVLPDWFTYSHRELFAKIQELHSGSTKLPLRNFTDIIRSVPRIALRAVKWLLILLLAAILELGYIPQTLSGWIWFTCLGIPAFVGLMLLSEVISGGLFSETYPHTKLWRRTKSKSTIENNQQH